MKIYVEKTYISGRKISINYEGKFTLKLLMKIKVEKPNVNKNMFGYGFTIILLEQKSEKNSGNVRFYWVFRAYAGAF